VFDVNVKSHFFLVRECLPHMREGSAVLIISSYAGSGERGSAGRQKKRVRRKDATQRSHHCPSLIGLLT